MNRQGPQWNYPRIRKSNLSFFEVLDEQGWQNEGLTSHFYFEMRPNIRQGFDAWDNEGAGTIAESNEDIAAPRIWKKTSARLEELARQREQKREAGEELAPHALFIHLFEPHSRWIEHEEHDFGDAREVPQRYIDYYDSEIAFADVYFGKIVDKLRETGLYDDAVVVVTSDHGEAFDEHGFLFHGQTLFDEVLRVPLLVRVPGWYDRTLEGPVSLVDVAPTLLDLWELPIPNEFEGISHVPAMLGRNEVARRPIYAELLPYTNWEEHHKVVIEGSDKFYRVLTAGTEQLFDLEEDPGEKTDISAEEPERARELGEKLVDGRRGRIAPAAGGKRRCSTISPWAPGTSRRSRPSTRRCSDCASCGATTATTGRFARSGSSSGRAC
jgi:arylsulfatase A-like enzyme